ncbi:MAG: hypothetical protein ACREEK_12880 [Bradyrhizobium sp.]
MSVLADDGLPSARDALWQDRVIIWKDSATWQSTLTAWLQPVFRKDALKRLKPGVFRDVCWDDTDWLDVLDRSLKQLVGGVTDDLADALRLGVIRTYHGCRTEDAGSYFRDGLLVHRNEALKVRARAIVDAHPELEYMKDTLEQRMAEKDTAHDEGRAYVVVSDESLLKFGGHYMIQGSEWIMSLFDGYGQRFLRAAGAPTLIEIDLPFSRTLDGDRRAFAKGMLMEWTRLTCNGEEWIAPIDISFLLFEDLPASCIVGHTHPATVRDPHNLERVYRSPLTTCRHCAPQGTGTGA